MTRQSDWKSNRASFLLLLGLNRYIGWPKYLADTDTYISVSANWISVSAISVSALVSANLDIGYIGIRKIPVKNMDIAKISAKMPNIVKISVNCEDQYR